MAKLVVPGDALCKALLPELWEPILVNAGHWVLVLRGFEQLGEAGDAVGAIPFQLVPASAGLDTWHVRTLVTQKLRRKLPHVRESGSERLCLSGRMEISVPYLEIGVKVGTIKFDKIKALVVDDGDNDILLGSELIMRAFELGEREAADVSVASAWKEDSTALSIELYPIEMPFDVLKIERYLRSQRRLYNILLIVDKGLSFSDRWQLENAIENDANLSSDYTLKSN